MQKENAHVLALSEILLSTGIVEVAIYQEKVVNAETGLTVLSTLSRLLHRDVKEKMWVERIVKPLRMLGWSHPEWTIRTDKTYFDKEAGGIKKVVFGFKVEITSTDPENVIKMVRSTLAHGKLPSPDTRSPQGIQTIAELPDEVIEKPLAHSPASRNERVSIPSRAGGYKKSAGVDNL